jgi:hypothetical protein
MDDMRQLPARRAGRAAQMVPAMLRVWLRRMRRRSRTRATPPPVWTAVTALGTLEVSPARPTVLLDDVDVGRLSCRVDAGTSTAECASRAPDELGPALVELVVASVRSDVRRVAWFVPIDDAVLESTLSAAGFACEGWAAPPVGETREHRQWALLT